MKTGSNVSPTLRDELGSRRRQARALRRLLYAQGFLVYRTYLPGPAIGYPFIVGLARVPDLVARAGVCVQALDHQLRLAHDCLGKLCLARHWITFALIGDNVHLNGDGCSGPDPCPWPRHPSAAKTLARHAWRLVHAHRERLTDLAPFLGAINDAFDVTPSWRRLVDPGRHSEGPVLGLAEWFTRSVDAEAP